MGGMGGMPEGAGNDTLKDYVMAILVLINTNQILFKGGAAPGAGYGSDPTIEEVD